MTALTRVESSKIDRYQVLMAKGAWHDAAAMAIQIGRDATTTFGRQSWAEGAAFAAAKIGITLDSTGEKGPDFDAMVEQLDAEPRPAAHSNPTRLDRSAYTRAEALAEIVLAEAILDGQSALPGVTLWGRIASILPEAALQPMALELTNERLNAMVRDFIARITPSGTRILVMNEVSGVPWLELCICCDGAIPDLGYQCCFNPGHPGDCYSRPKGVYFQPER